jgi:(2R)-3-sulfolactate dehydrogenase (NADP+)
MARLTLDEIYERSQRALTACGASDRAADVVADSMREAEAQGLSTHGMAYLLTYLRHLRIGKIAGAAEPTWATVTPALLRVDAAHGFAHRAFADALDDFEPLAHSAGVAAMAVTRSYSAGVLGWFVDRLARRGLVSLAFANASALMPAWGGRTPRFGTNPLAFGCPVDAAEPIVFDMAVSTTARVNVLAAARRGERLPVGWALDTLGQPTTDPAAALAGMNSPLGGAKGYGLALMVDVLAAALTGSNLSLEASGLLSDEGGPPAVGQLFVAFAPDRFGGGALGEPFGVRVARLVAALHDEPDVRLPGQRRQASKEAAERDGVEVADDILAQVDALS